MRPRIFVTQPVAKSALDRLRKIASVKINPDASRIIAKKALIAGVRRCDILFSLLHDRIDREVIAANPQLRAVASQSITPDNIDVAEATRRRIPVTVVPPIVAEATADINFGLMLMVARRMVEGDRLVHKGRFPGSQSSHLAGSAVYGKTIGLIGGGGRIGRAVARRARGFGMRVLYWSPRRRPESLEREFEMTYLPLDQLLGESDFVSLHSPLNAQTRHQIGKRELALMKRTAFLINTARGAIVDEAALARALERRQIAGAGLDVFEHEPRVTPALLGESDFVSLHSPLNAQTRHQIGKHELALMKRTAFLINTARGGIINEAALAWALERRQIAGAGLDVFEHEPRVTPALLEMSNVVTTPHLGSAVVEVREQMANIVVDNILAVLAGRTPPNCVNPEVLRG